MGVEQHHPDSGARYLLEREQVSDDLATARYRASIYTVSQRFDYSVEIDLGGEHRIQAAGERAEAMLEKRLDGFLRQLARASTTKKDDGIEPWPTRILRWRGPGRG